MTTWQLIQGDAGVETTRLATESVQCVVTSPPYFWQRDYEVDGQLGHEPTVEGYVGAVTAALSPLLRVLRRDGTLFLNIGDTYYSGKGQPGGSDSKQDRRNFARRILRAVDRSGLGPPRKSLLGIPWRVALALQGQGWTLRAGVVWRKSSPVPEPTVLDRPRVTTEHVFILARTPRYYFDRRGLEGDEDVWHLAAPAGAGHAAPFPLALAERCIRCGSRQGDTVLDPFAGSGTTLRAAVGLGRRAIGIELSPRYAADASLSLAEATRQQSLSWDARAATKEQP